MIDAMVHLVFLMSGLLTMGLPLCAIYCLWLLAGKLLGFVGEDYFASEDWGLQLKALGLCFLGFLIFIIFGLSGYHLY